MNTSYITEFELIIILKSLLNEGDFFEFKINSLSHYLSGSLRENLIIIEHLSKMRGFDLKFDFVEVQDNSDYAEINGFKELDNVALKYLTTINKNYTAKNNLLFGIEDDLTSAFGAFYTHDQDDYSFEDYVNKGLEITFQTTKDFYDLAKNFLTEQVRIFELGKLNIPSICNYKTHLKTYSRFLKVIEDKYMSNSVTFTKNKLQNALGLTQEEIDEYRFIEFLLLLEQKKYLNILNVEFDNDKNWIIQIKKLIAADTIENIEENWTTFGSLKTNFCTSETHNAGIECDFQNKTTIPYRILKLLLEKEGAPISLEQISNYIWGDGDFNKLRIEAQIKELRKKVHHNHEDSTIKICVKNNAVYIISEE